MRTFSLRRSGPVLAIAFAALFASQGASYASSTSDTRTQPLESVDLVPGAFPFGSGIPTGEWKVGDCHMHVNSFVAVSGNLLRLRAITGTDHTNSADIWHNSFKFLDFQGRVLYSTGGSQYDSPRMVPINGRSSGPSTQYTWERDVTLPVDQSFGIRIATVIWTSAC